eukprot:GILK01011448.1.p1 GENE.GILK01011448.1~~GILK01011448.1.p1  ORF type:complete len:462 (+),score=64.60 GILK01011448.1:70-1455(+)
MECSIPATRIKLLLKAIQTLSKIGKDLFVEAGSNKIVFRTLNDAKSAFLAITFDADFFEVYSGGEDDSVVKCKIPVKSTLAVFKNMQQVERLVLRIDNERPDLIFQLHCKSGMSKTHKFVYSDCEIFQAAFDRKDCKHSLRASPKLLSHGMGNFPLNLEEVSLVVHHDTVKIKSHLDNVLSDASKAMQTELAILASDFEQFGVEAASEISLTFCLKEFRAILSICEFAERDVGFYFQGPGRPILFTAEHSEHADTRTAFSVTLVVATLVEDSAMEDDSQLSSSPSATSSSMHSNDTSVSQESDMAAHSSKRKAISSQSAMRSKKLLRASEDRSVSSQQMHISDFSDFPSDSDGTSSKQKAPRSAPVRALRTPQPPAIPTPQQVVRSSSIVGRAGHPVISPAKPPQALPVASAGASSETEDEDEEDFVPATPLATSDLAEAEQRARFNAVKESDWADIDNLF